MWQYLELEPSFLKSREPSKNKAKQALCGSSFKTNFPKNKYIYTVK